MSGVPHDRLRAPQFCRGRSSRADLPRPAAPQALPAELAAQTHPHAHIRRARLARLARSHRHTAGPGLYRRRRRRLLPRLWRPRRPLHPGPVLLPDQPARAGRRLCPDGQGQTLAALAHAPGHPLQPAARPLAGTRRRHLSGPRRHLPAMPLRHGHHGLPRRSQARPAVARRNAVRDCRLPDRREQVCDALCVCGAGDCDDLFFGAGFDCGGGVETAMSWPYSRVLGSSLSDTHYGPASGIFRASPEHIASISTALGGTLDHGGIALRAAGHLRLLWGHEGGRCGRRFAWLTLVLSYPLFEDGPVDQLDITARCKVLRFLGEPAGSDDKTACRPLHCHGTKELADNRDAHLERAPVLALHQILFTVLAQDQIYAAIGAVTAGFGDAVTLAAEGFADQLFKLAPVEAIDGFARLGGGLHVIDEFLAVSARSDRSDRSYHAGHGDKVLADQGEGPNHLTSENATHIVGCENLGGVDRCSSDRMQNKPRDKCDRQTNPPGQPGQYCYQVLKTGGTSATSHPLVSMNDGILPYPNHTFLCRSR